jgi:glyoxylase-like metal-dependent hydrolase (beta-lactamase superfamily II)
LTPLYLPLTILLVTTQLIAQENAATQRLAEQSKQFNEQVIQVADNVYTAVGFSVSNVSMIVGDDGVVIVDTGMTLDDARRIMAEFRKLSDKPVKAIIFTHSHGDHTGGATAFFGNERPQIWAHKNFGSEASPLVAGGVTFQSVRGARQAGFKLPPEQRINNGVAPVRYPVGHDVSGQLAIGVEELLADVEVDRLVHGSKGNWLALATPN